MNRAPSLWRRVFVSLVLGLLSGVGFAIYVLRVDDIRVTGLRTLDPKSIIDASGLHPGERILWIRLSVITHRLETIPAVASVTVERSLPRTVIIRVRERAPIARLGSHPQLSVDVEGRVFAALSPPPLPLLDGWRGVARAGREVDAATANVLRAYGKFPQALRVRTVRISIGPPLVVWLADGTEVRFGAHSDLVDKAVIALAVVEAEGGKPLAYVDVRSPAVPVSRRRAPPTPAPTTAPEPRSPETPTPAPTASPSGAGRL